MRWPPLIKLMVNNSVVKSHSQNSFGGNSFLQANEEAFRELITFVDFAPEKFTIGFVSVNFPSDQATITKELSRHPDCQDIQFVQYTFDDSNLRFLQDELIQKIPEIEREPDKKLVLLLTGLEASIKMVGELADYPPMLVNLNYVRDGFTTNVPYPVIIFLPDRALSRLAEFAPDFWAWRRAVIRFESMPEAVKSKMYQLVRQDDSKWLGAGKKATYEALDFRARQDTIPRLLMEYESGSLVENEDFKAFKYELMAELGTSLYDDDNLDAARNILKQALTTEDLGQSKFSRSQIRSYLGRIERDQGKYEEALKLFNELVSELESLVGSLSPIYGVFIRVSIISLLARRFPKKLSRLNRKIKLHSEYKQALVNRGMTYRMMQRYPKAISDFDRAVEADSDYERAIINRGVTYRLMKRYSEAIADFDHAIKLDADDEWVIANRGYTYQLMKCYSEAIADFDRAIELDPEYDWAITQRGITYGMTQRYLEAIIDFDRAIELNPEYDWVIAQRGVTYQLMERYPEAIADFDQAIELEPKNDRALTSRGYTYQLMKRYPEAITDFDRAIELDPESDWAITSRGQTHYLNYQYEQAFKDFDNATNLNDKDAWNVEKRGEVNLLLGHYESALQDFELSLKLKFDDWTLHKRSLAYTALKHMEKAKADTEQAIKIAEQVYRAGPQDCRNIFNLAICHLVAGELDKARHLYQDSLEKKPSTEVLREAIRDVEDLLTVLPNFPNSEELRSYLQSALASRLRGDADAAQAD